MVKPRNHSHGHASLLSGSVWHYFHHYVHHYVHLDIQLWPRNTGTERGGWEGGGGSQPLTIHSHSEALKVDAVESPVDTGRSVISLNCDIIIPAPNCDITTVCLT